MIRLTARRRRDGAFAFTISRDDVALLKTTDSVEAAQRLLTLGIDNPQHLVVAAREWGEVEIREDANPDWRGG